MDYLVRFASTTEDLDAAYALRRDVFEREQNVPRPLDRDASDFNADHVVAIAPDGNCVGTGRVVRVDARTCQIGRMAVAATHRERGIGALVLDALERISALRGVAEILVHSQLPSERFFRNRGYVLEGRVFEDQGVPHVLMRKVLPHEALYPDAPLADRPGAPPTASRTKPGGTGEGAKAVKDAAKATAKAKATGPKPAATRKVRAKVPAPGRPVGKLAARKGGPQKAARRTARAR